MSIVNRTVLKGYFADAKVPTASNFGDFIDSALNLANAGITIDQANRFGLGTSDPGAALSVQPQTLLPMTGTVSVAINSTAVTGTGTIFTQELATGTAIRIAGLVFMVASIASDTSLTLDIAFPAASGPQTNVPAYRDGDAFSIANGVAHSLMVIDQAGNMGVGVAAPGTMLDVGGTVRATGFVGNGAGLTGLNAGQLSGTLVSTGSFDVALTGLGAIVAGGTMVTGTGTLFTTQLVVGDALQLTTPAGSTVFTVAAIVSDTQLTVSAAATTAIANAGLATLGALFEARTQAGLAAFTVDKTGAVTAPGFIGSGAALTGIEASQISGSFTPSQIPDIPAAKVTGQLAVAQIPDLRAVQVLFYTDTPAVIGTDSVVLKWIADSSYALTLTYLSSGVAAVKSSTNGDFAPGTGAYTVRGIYSDTLFTLTAASGGQTIYQRQLSVSVVLTPAQFATLVNAAHVALPDAISDLYYQYNYNPVDLTMIDMLGYALAVAGYAASDIFRDVASFYIATAGITTLSSAQIKALSDGVERGSSGG